MWKSFPSTLPVIDDVQPDRHLLLDDTRDSIDRKSLESVPS